MKQDVFSLATLPFTLLRSGHWVVKLEEWMDFIARPLQNYNSHAPISHNIFNVQSFSIFLCQRQKRQKITKGGSDIVGERI